MPAMQAMVSRRVSASRQGQLQGGLGAMGSVSAIVAPLLLTQVLAWGLARGFAGASFVIAGLLSLTAAGVVVARVRPA